MNPTDTTTSPRVPQDRATIVVLLISIMFAVGFSWFSFEKEKRHQVDILSSILDVSLNSVNSYFSLLDVALYNLARDLAEVDERGDLDHAYILARRFLEIRPELNDISLIRPDGQILLTGSHPPGPSLPALGPDSQFRRYLDELAQGRAQTIGEPLVGALRGQVVIPLRHPIRDRNGALKYIVSATIPADFLKSLWKDARIARTTPVGLLRDNGYLVGRYPMPDARNIREVFARPRTGALLDHLKAHGFPAAGQMEGKGSVDPVDNLYVFRRLPDYPLTMYAGMPMSGLRAAWWQTVEAPFTLAILGLLAGLAGLRYYAGRQRAWEREQLRINEALRQITANYNELVARIPVGVYRLRLRKDGTVVYEYMSQNFCQIMHVDMVAALQDESVIFKDLHPEDRERLVDLRHEAVEAASPLRWEGRFVFDGEMRWIRMESNSVALPDGDSLWNGVVSDITAQKLTQIELDKLAFYDRLTGLPNRRMLEDRLEQLIARAARDQRRIALLFIDLDKFKPINDQMGHAMGDWLLQRVAERMQDCLRKSDTVARIGGDEFVVLLPDMAAAREALGVAEKIRVSLADPFVTEDGDVLSISSSIGVVLFPDHAASSGDLIRVGDEAMYRAKKAGRNAVEILDEPVESSEPAFVVKDRSIVRLVWRPDFACGEAVIDDEHQDLFRRANALLDMAVRSDPNPERLGRTLDALLLHVATHFAHEEEILRSRDYDELHRHAELHARLLEQAAELRRKTGDSALPVGDLVEFLVSKLVAGHILTHDIRYFPLFSKEKQPA